MWPAASYINYRSCCLVEISIRIKTKTPYVELCQIVLALELQKDDFASKFFWESQLFFAVSISPALSTFCIGLINTAWFKCTNTISVTSLFLFLDVISESCIWFLLITNIFRSQIGEAAVMFLAIRAGDLGSTPRSDDKWVALVA